MIYMAKRDEIEPAGPQNAAAKKAAEERTETRRQNIDQNKRDDPNDQR